MATKSEVSCKLDVEDSLFDVRDMWFTNMLLLGFDPVQAEVKYKIVFDRDTFSHPRKQAMFVVLHHLFSQLNSRLAYEEFRDCWPVHDSKQDQAFRKKVSNWIKIIAKEEPSYGLPLIIAPLLLSPGGDKFYIFLQVFSSYCLHKVLLREAKGMGKEVFLPSSVTNGVKGMPLFDDIYERSTQVHTVIQCNHLMSKSLEVSQLHNKWKEYSKELVSDYQRLSKEKKELEKQLDELGERTDNDSCPPLANLLSASSNSTITNISRENQKKKVESLWKRVEEFVKTTKDECEIIEYVTEPGNTNKYCIDGTSLKLQVSNNESSLHHNVSSLHHNESSLHHNVSSVDKEGKRTPDSLAELVDVCSLSVNALHDHLCKGVPPLLPDLTEEVEFAAEQVRTHSSHLTSAQQLKSMLSKHGEVLKERIRVLEPQLKEMRKLHQSEGIKGISSLLPISLDPSTLHNTPHPIKTSQDLSLLSPSPQVKVGLTPPTSFTPFRPIVNKTVGSTPRAVETITRNIQENARRQIVSNFKTETAASTNIRDTLPVMVSDHITVLTSSDSFNDSSTNSVHQRTKVLATVDNTPVNRGRGGKKIKPHAYKSGQKLKREEVGGREGRGSGGGKEKERLTDLNSSPLRNGAPPSSPGDLLAEEIVASVMDPSTTPINKSVSQEEEQLAFISRDCIGRTPVEGKVKKTVNKFTDHTPSGSSNWLTEETPPTPFHEVRSTESPEDLLSLSISSPACIKDEPLLPLVNNKNINSD